MQPRPTNGIKTVRKLAFKVTYNELTYKIGRTAQVHTLVIQALVHQLVLGHLGHHRNNLLLQIKNDSSLSIVNFYL